MDRWEHPSPAPTASLIKQLLRDTEKKLRVPDAAAELARMDKEDAELGAKLAKSGIPPETEPRRPGGFEMYEGRWCGLCASGCRSCEPAIAWNSWADRTGRPRTGDAL